MNTPLKVNASILEPDDMPSFRKWLNELLHEGIVSVTFRKTDGTTRVMKATLSSEMIPAQPLTESEEPKKERKVNDAVMAVWDTEANGWRSFRLDRIISIQFSLMPLPAKED